MYRNLFGGSGQRSSFTPARPEIADRRRWTGRFVEHLRTPDFQRAHVRSASARSSTQPAAECSPISIRRAWDIGLVDAIGPKWPDPFEVWLNKVATDLLEGDRVNSKR